MSDIKLGFQNYMCDFDGQYRYDGCPADMDGFSIPFILNPDSSITPIKEFHWERKDDEYYREGFGKKDIGERFYAPLKSITTKPLYNIPATFFKQEDGYTVPEQLSVILEESRNKKEKLVELKDENMKDVFTINFNKEPMMTNEFFEMITEKLDVYETIKAISKDSTILDYVKSNDYDTKAILDDDFYVTTETDFGGSEGIYIDVFLNKYERREGKPKRIDIGTIKTLSDSWEALEHMSVLAVRIRKTARQVISENRLRFIRHGYCIVEPKDSEMDKHIYQESDLRLKPGLIYCTDDPEQLVEVLNSSKTARLIDFSSRTDVTEQYRKDKK